MATQNELLDQAVEIRDAEQEGENTALRVGSLLVDIIQTIGDHASNVDLDNAITQLWVQLRAVFAQIDSTSLLRWHQSPIVFLKSMGHDLDDVDGGYYTPTYDVGDVWYSNGALHHKVSEQQTQDYSIRTNCIYVNKHTLRCYEYKSSSFVELTNENRALKNRRVIDDMEVTDLNGMSVGEVAFLPATKKIAIKTAERSWITFSPDPNKIYCDKDARTTMIWDADEETWQQVGGSGEGGSLAITYDGIDTLIISDPASAVYIQVSSGTFAFGDTEQGSTATKTLKVKGHNLTSGITLALTDTSGAFSVSPALITAANANQESEITISYEPTVLGSNTAKITLTSGDVTAEVNLSGRCVEQIVPTITLNYGEASQSMRAEEGETATVNIPITGENLTPGATVSIAVTGTGISVSPTSLTVDEEGTISGTLAVSWVAGSSNVNGTLAASVGGTQMASVSLACTVATRLAAGSYWYDEFYRFQVLDDRTKVGISQNPDNKPSGEITLPTSANDSGKTVYNSNGEEVEASDMNYQVTQIINPNANSSPFIGAQITKVIVPEGYTNLTTRTFDFGASGTGLLKEVYLPSTLIAWGGGWDFRNQPLEKLVIAATQTWGDAGFYINAPLQYVEFGLGVTNCNKQNMYLNIGSTTKVVARPTTPPVVAYNFFGSNYTQGTLYVPSAAKSAYEAASYWSSFSSIKTIEDDLPNDLENL